MSGESAEMPVDPDVAEVATGRPRPVHLRASFLGLVFVGGAVGTAVREGLSLAWPPRDGVPYTIFAINVVGAFLLGLLLEVLVSRGPDEGARRRWRLLLGTGVLGGFTTYSALADDTARLLLDGRIGAGVGYAAVTLVVGGFASAAGIAAGGLQRSRRGAA